jgi:hypothetical protein
VVIPREAWAGAGILLGPSSKPVGVRDGVFNPDWAALGTCRGPPISPQIDEPAQAAKGRRPFPVRGASDSLNID